MEWIVALELHKRGRGVKAIFPIVMGEQMPDGSYSDQFFMRLRDGQVHWPAVGDDVAAGFGDLPNIVSAKTTAKVSASSHGSPSFHLFISLSLLY